LEGKKMKKSTILIIASLFLVIASCGKKEPSVELPDPTPNEPEVYEKSAGHYVGDILDFNSEEELFEYLQSEDRDTDKESRFTMPTHYYKFRNPPQDAIIILVSVYNDVNIMYDTQRTEFESMNIRLIPVLPFDVMEKGMWGRGGMDGKFTAEKDGIIYYFIESAANWIIEWNNADGYYFFVQFPYRFTADEVLGYVSDLERVEIG